MKTLTLLRHAKSGWDDPSLSDAARPLNAKGRRAAAAIGRHLRATGARFDHVIASPAVRVRQTIDAVASGYGAKPAPVWDQRLYLASDSSLIDVIRGLPDDRASVILVGHNPGLEDLVLALVPSGSGPLRDEAALKYPTATIAELRFEIDHWAEIAPGTATLATFTRPRDLDPTLGPDEE